MMSNSRIVLTVILAISMGLPIRSKAEESGVAGAVFVMTNAAEKNEIIAYQAWRNLGEAYYWAPGERSRSQEAFQKAIALAKERLAINPRDLDALYETAFCYAMLQEGGPALDYLKRALNTSSDDPELLLTAGKVYVLLGKPEQGLGFLTQAVNAQYSRFVIRDDPAFKTLANNVQFQKLVGGLK